MWRSREIIAAMVLLLVVGPGALAVQSAPGLQAPASADTDAELGALGEGCSFTGTRELVEDVESTASLEDQEGASCEFSFQADPSETHARVRIYFLDGYFQMYAKVGAPPTTDDYDCFPDIPGGIPETCEVPHEGQTVYVMILREDRSGEFTIIGTSFTPPPPPPKCSLGDDTVTVLEEGVPVTGEVYDVEDAACHFSFQAADGFDAARVTMDPKTLSDLDLYIRIDAEPTLEAYDCRPWRGGTTTEMCEVLVEPGETLHMMVYREFGGSEFEIVAESFDLEALPIGQPMPLTLGYEEGRLFKVVVPEGASTVHVNIAGDTAGLVCELAPGCSPWDVSDVDLLVSHERIPYAVEQANPVFYRKADCEASISGNVDSCTFSDELADQLGQPGSPAHAHPMDGPGRYAVRVFAQYGEPAFVLTAVVD